MFMNCRLVWPVPGGSGFPSGSMLGHMTLLGEFGVM